MSSPEAETVALPLPADLVAMPHTPAEGIPGATWAPQAQLRAPVQAQDANSAPTPARRLPSRDEHRLALQAKLTELGVPPAPGDRTALAQLSALDEQLITTVLNWLSCAADPGAAASRAAEPPRARPSMGHIGPAPSAERHTDPRLLSW